MKFLRKESEKRVLVLVRWQLADSTVPIWFNDDSKYIIDLEKLVSQNPK